MKIGLIRTSLPSYFPEKHGVWASAEEMLQAFCDAQDCTLLVAPDIPMNGAQTQAVLEGFTAQGIDFVLVLHGGFTMGDVARPVAASSFRCGFWSVPDVDCAASARSQQASRAVVSRRARQPGSAGAPDQYDPRTQSGQGTERCAQRRDRRVGDDVLQYGGRDLGIARAPWRRNGASRYPRAHQPHGCA